MLRAQHCPQDILYIIFRHLQSLSTSQGFRAGLCLVCRAWSLAATPLLLHDVEPGSRRSLKALLSTVQMSPGHASLIRKLRFPQFNRHFSPGEFLQVKYHRDRFPDIPVYKEAVATGHMAETDIDALVPLFLSVADHCPNLVMLDLPLYRIGDWCPNPSQFASIEVLSLQGHAPHDESTQQWQFECATKFLESLVYVLPHLHTLNLSVFSYRSYIGNVFPQIKSSHFPSLKTVCTHDNDISALLQFSTLYSTFSARLERTVLISNLPFWRYEGIFPVNMKFTSRLELGASTLWTKLELGGSPFSLVTTLLVELSGYFRLNRWLEELPPALETLILSFRLKGHHPSRPFLRAKAVADVRERLATYPRLKYFRTTWSANKRECDIWEILAFCLHEMYVGLGIRLQTQLRLGMSSEFEWLECDTDIRTRQNLSQARSVPRSSINAWFGVRDGGMKFRYIGP